jgi:glucose-1-phosphate cytidylyltransferase
MNGDSPTAVLLCGGRGERLRPLTEATPKPLVHLNGRPILSYLLDHIAHFGIRKIVVAAGFQAEKLVQFFADTPNDFDVQIVNSGDVDIIQRIKDCAPHIAGDFLVLYGDTLADVDLDDLRRFHRSHNTKATITVWPLVSQFGLVELDGEDTVTRFREKPTLDQWINIGNFCFDHEVLAWMEPFSSYSEFLASLGARGRLKGYRHTGVHITVNTMRELEDAQQNVHQLGRTYQRAER